MSKAAWKGEKRLREIERDGRKERGEGVDEKDVTREAKRGRKMDSEAKRTKRETRTRKMRRRERGKRKRQARGIAK